MAYPVYQGTGGIAVATTGNLAITFPSGASVGDIFIAVILRTDNDVPAAPAGWTLIQSQIGTASDYSYASYWRRKDGLEGATQTFVSPSTYSGAFAGIIYRFNGCIATGTPYESLLSPGAAPTTGTTKTVTPTAPTGAERLGIVLGITEDDTATSIAGTGWTSSSGLTSALGTDVSFALATKNLNNGDSVGTVTLTMSTSLDFASVVSLMLLPNPDPEQPYYSGQGALASVTSGNLAVGYPADVLANDILFIQVFHSFSLSLTTPSGWTLITEKSFTSGEDFYVFWKRAAGGETGTVSITNSYSEELKGVMCKFTNCKITGTPYENYDNGNSQTYNSTISYSLGNSSGNKRTAVIIVISDDDLTFTDTSTGYVKKLDEKSAGTFDIGLRLFTQNIATSATNDGTVSGNFTSYQYNNSIGLFLLPITPANIININVGDTWKNMVGAKINIGDTWKTVTSIKINVGDVWKDVI